MNNKKKVLIGILLVLVIIVLFFVTYYIVTNHKKSDNDNITESINNKNNDEEENIKNTEQVEQLMKMPHYVLNPFDSKDYFGYFYNNDYYLSENIPNDLKLYLIIYTLNDSNEVKSEIKKEEIDSTAKRIFGSNVTVEVASHIDLCDGSYDYNYENNMYIKVEDGACGGIRESYKTRTIEVNDFSEYIEVTEKVWFILPLNPIEIYTNKDVKIKIGSVENIDDVEEYVNQYLDKLDSFKYTFKRENDNYYLYSVEKVK